MFHSYGDIMNQPIPQNSTAASNEQEITLYKSHKVIHARSVTGVFANWRWILVWFTQLLFYGLCWLPWNDRQAVLFDLVEIGETGNAALDLIFTRTFFAR